MSLWIKICGNTSLEDARLAVEAGADALGFVFAKSPRRVTVAQAAAITKALEGRVETIGVFVDATPEEIERTVQACRLTGVQLHGEYGPEAPAELRRRLGAETKILRVAHFSQNVEAGIRSYLEDANVAAVLIDSRTQAAVGGTGVAFDWEAARKTLFADAAIRARLIVAGGLAPENVTEAVTTLRPGGIDAVSGVETAPGRKDPAKVRAFLERARAAQRLCDAR
jgi:phosphoribosylanthranilate isomerase